MVLSLDDVVIVQYQFFTGIGYLNTGLDSPTTAQWDAALIPALNSLDLYGFEYILNEYYLFSCRKLGAWVKYEPRVYGFT